MKQERKPHLSIALLGARQAGKATLTGYLLYRTGVVSEENFFKVEQESKHAGKPEEKYSWLIHKRKDEKKTGTTLSIYKNDLETKKYHILLYDPPAVRNLINKTIVAISQADCAIMMVNSHPASLQAEVLDEGAIMQHALLAYTYGLRQIVVCMNKMDHPEVNYQEQIYLKGKEKVSSCLKKAGYNPQKITFIPTSAWQGDNIVDKSPNMPWYKGPTLVELIDSIPEVKKTNNKPLRIAIGSIFKKGQVGTIITGKVLAGSVKVGMELVCAPKMLNCTVASMQIDRIPIEQAHYRQNVGIHLEGIQPIEISCGHVLGPRVNGAMGKVDTFTAHIIMVHPTQQLFINTAFILNCHTSSVECTLTKIESKINKFTGKVIEQNPNRLIPGQAAIVTIRPLRHMCMDVYNQFPDMGRFVMMIQNENLVLGVGVTRTVDKV